MEDSILKSVKRILGLAADDASFDLDILTYIGDALATLDQVGIDPIEVKDDTAKWDDMDLTPTVLGKARAFVILQVQLLWDPPTLSFLIELKERQLAEKLTRVRIAKEHEAAT